MGSLYSVDTLNQGPAQVRKYDCIILEYDHEKKPHFLKGNYENKACLRYMFESYTRIMDFKIYIWIYICINVSCFYCDSLLWKTDMWIRVQCSMLIVHIFTRFLLYCDYYNHEYIYILKNKFWNGFCLTWEVFISITQVQENITDNF